MIVAYTRSAVEYYCSLPQKNPMSDAAQSCTAAVGRNDGVPTTQNHVAYHIAYVSHRTWN